MPQEFRVNPRLLELQRAFVECAALDAAALDRALRHFELGSRDESHLEELRRAAHRLVGRLGMFGFSDACAEAQLFGRSILQQGDDPSGVLRTGGALVATLRNLPPFLSAASER